VLPAYLTRFPLTRSPRARTNDASVGCTFARTFREGATAAMVGLGSGLFASGLTPFVLSLLKSNAGAPPRLLRNDVLRSQPSPNLHSTSWQAGAFAFVVYA
jgi:hypothetical protein